MTELIKDISKIKAYLNELNVQGVRNMTVVVAITSVLDQMTEKIKQNIPKEE